MRGKILIVLILIFSTFFFVSAEDAKNTSPISTQTGKEILGKVNNGTEDILQKEVILPSWLIIPAKILGIDKVVTWQNLIITLTILAGLFMVIFSTMEILPFLNQGITKFLGALVITALISITGAIYQISNFLLNIAGFFEWTNNYSMLRIILAIIITLIIIFIFNYASKKLKIKIKIKTAELKGKKINETFEDLEAVDKIDKIRLGENP